VKLLLVTDVAARGIDIPLLDNVVHYGGYKGGGGQPWAPRGLFDGAAAPSLLAPPSTLLPPCPADFPPKPKLFVHRSGRAARAGRVGISYSLLTRCGCGEVGGWDWTDGLGALWVARPSASWAPLTCSDCSCLLRHARAKLEGKSGRPLKTITTSH
jgi:hypothetical protein